MGIFRINGILGRKVPSAINLTLEQLEKVNLKAVKSAVAAYDPFDERSIATRKFLQYINHRNLARKYPDFKINVNIKCDRTEPTVTFDLGKQVVFKAGNLTFLEMFELYNKHITPHAPEEEKARDTLATKQMRKGKK